MTRSPKGIKNFKPKLKTEGGETSLTGVKSASGTHMFEGQCASEVLCSAPQWRKGIEPRGSKDTRVVDVRNHEEPENKHVGMRASPLKKRAGSVAQLKCIYTVHTAWATERIGSHCEAGKLV